MQRTSVAALGIVALLLMGSRLAPAEAQTIVHFHNGDFAAGQLLDSDDASHIQWLARGFEQPLRFPIDRVKSLQFPLFDKRTTLPGPYHFELRGGGWLGGQLLSLDERVAVLEIAGLGKLHVDRNALLRFYRASPTDLIFAGPTGLDGWKTGGPDQAWAIDGGPLKTDQPGASLGRDFDVPPLVRYEFELSWSKVPNFEIVVGRKANPPNSAAFRIETWGKDLVVTRETETLGDVAVLQKIQPGAGQVGLLVLFDQKKGQLLVYSAAGEKLADFTVPEDKPKAAAPKNPAGRRMMAPVVVPDNPDLPGGLQIINRSGDLKVQRLTINRWSGVVLPPAAAGQAAIHRVDGAIQSADVRSFDPDARQLIVVEEGSEQRLDEKSLQGVVFAPVGKAPDLATCVLLTNGTQLKGTLTKIQLASLTLQCPGIEESLVLPLGDIQFVFLSKSEKPAEVVALSASDALLELPGISLRGRLVDATTGDHSCLVFQPRQSTLSSPLAANVSGRLVLREPPPPAKPEVSEEFDPSPAKQIVNGISSIFGALSTLGSVRAMPPGECLLHLRSGDTLPCRVEFIDERGITFKSTVTNSTFVPHQQIKALELRLDAPPVKIEKSKFERLLTLPRFQRDNPPEQLIRSLEGDYLRGRLLAMNDKELKLELRLEPKTIDRSQVTRILWLHPDEASKATVGKSVQPAGANDPPTGTRIQSVPRGGNRLTFFAQQLSGKTLSGQSEVLGACRVELDQVDQLLIGETIDTAAAELAFHQWKLRPALEPLPEPESGSSEGMESVLVGKPAPPIELNLLDGNKFRLDDCKGKVVVLDFWASWCGPCLQAMPQIDTVSREFATQGVQLVAINLQESPEQIKAALSRLKLSTAVALDVDGRVAERYGATSIPQTVIIDRDGKIARLFVGGGARFDEQLRQSLKAVLTAAKADAREQQ